MANRRFGGGGPPQKLGRSFPQQQQYHGNSVNPWQGGVTPNNLNADLLSQLSGPQAQLALALSSLLQTQQPQQMNNPPSLLSLNTSPAFNNQDTYGSQSRFSNRNSRDFRRPEPFNKNRNASGGGTWRSEANSRVGVRVGSSFSSGRSNFRSNIRNQKSPPRGKIGKTNNKTPVSTSDKSKSVKTPDKNEADSSKNIEDNETVDISVDESRDEDGGEIKEKKRDWKEEKNTADEKDGKQREKKDSESAVDLTEDPNGATDDEKKKEAGVKRPRDGRYQGVPASLLHCFVCNKSMWDGESYQNHIRGKAHKQMMDSLEESFQITVNILRENMRLTEEKKMIELDRIHRNSRSFHRRMQEPQSHCNMCDLKFLGKIIIHRKTEGHQRLKRFLHPKCNHCNQEFPSRMEWVEHRFTPEHLRRLKEIMDDQSGNKDGAIIEEQLETNNDPLLEESLQTEDTNPILELTDDLKDLQNRIPAYKSTRAVSTASLKPITGFYCELCDRFLSTEALSQAHLKSERHYHQFVEVLKSKEKRANNEEKDDDDGNWKRRKLDNEDAAAQNEEEQMSTIKNEEEDGEAMYDPEEACKENESAEMMITDPADVLIHDEAKWLKIDAEIKNKEEKEAVSAETSQEVDEEESLEDIKEEFDEKVKTGRGRRGGAVRNGAGPKSRTKRK